MAFTMNRSLKELAEKWQAIKENVSWSVKDEEKSSLYYKGECVTNPLIVSRGMHAG